LAGEGAEKDLALIGDRHFCCWPPTPECEAQRADVYPMSNPISASSLCHGSNVSRNGLENESGYKQAIIRALKEFAITGNGRTPLIADLATGSIPTPFGWVAFRAHSVDRPMAGHHHPSHADSFHQLELMDPLSRTEGGIRCWRVGRDHQNFC
jgi:hypothetical protein